MGKGFFSKGSFMKDFNTPIVGLQTLAFLKGFCRKRRVMTKTHSYLKTLVLPKFYFEFLQT